MNRASRLCWRYFFAIIVLLVFLAIPSFAFAQTPVPPTPVSQPSAALTLDGAVDPSLVDVNKDVAITLSVVGDNTVCQAIETRRPLDIVLVVDRSPSMEDTLSGDYAGTKLDGALEAVGNFLSLMQMNDRIALVMFSGDAIRLTEFADADSVRQKLNAVRNAEGLFASGTNIEAGLSQASDLIETSANPTSSSIVILLTDGDENFGSAMSAAGPAKQAGIRIVTIGLGPDVQEELLRQVASQPSDYYFAPETAQLKNIYESIAKSIQTFDPATNIRVTYKFDSSNFELVEGSIQPEAQVSVNTITWEFSRLDNNRQNMALNLRPRVPGQYFASLNTRLEYLSCGQDPKTFELTDRLPVEVRSVGPEVPACQSLESFSNESSALSFFCNPLPWFWIGFLIVGLLLLLLWLNKYIGALRAWFRCGIIPPACIWIDLITRIWIAILAGILLNTLIGFVCASQRGIVFWRVNSDRSSAIYYKSISPDYPVRPLTPLVGDDQCVGCHTASVASQSVAGIQRGTNGLMALYDLHGQPMRVPTIQGAYPAWSPDGKKVAYAANNEDIYVWDVISGEVYPLPGASEPGIVESMPAWSSNGNEIAFTRASGSGQNVTITVPSDIMVIPSEGGVALLVPGASGNGFNYHPTFSPDGNWLAFTHHEEGSTTYGEPKAQIYIVPAGGGAPRRIQANDGPDGRPILDAGNTWPSWSLDSKTLYFSSRRCDNQYDIFATTIQDDGSSTPAERLGLISDPAAFEYGAQEVSLTPPSLLKDLLSIWPWLLPLVPLLFLLWLLCHRGSLRRKESTIEASVTAKPADGWLIPRQRFEVQAELLGKPVCGQQVIDRKADIVLLIDTSESMSKRDLGSHTRLEATRRAARRFVRCLVGKHMRVAISSFDDDAKDYQGFTNDEKSLKNAIDNITLGKSANMTLGINRAHDMLKNQGRKDVLQVIILLSSSAPDNPDSILEAASRVRKSGIRLITVGIGDANETLLRQMADETGSYRFASSEKDLEDALMTFSKNLISLPAGRQVSYIHRYDNTRFEVIHGSVIPQPTQQEPGMLVWQIDELDETPRYFRYLVRPLQSGDSLYIDQQGEISYQRCGAGPQVSMIVPPGARVHVRPGPPAPAKPRVLPERFRVTRPEVVWQPDRALFIGIGGSGRWLLTHIRKNLLDSGAGYLPEGIRFMILDTDEYEKINGQQVAVSFAGVEVPPEDVFVLDENLQEIIHQWASQDSSEYRAWFDARRYEGLNEQLNLVNGTHGMRQLPHLALLRNLQGVENLNSHWVKRQEQKKLNADLRTWIKERCHDVYRQDLDEVRIFICGSLAGGMSGVLLDVANLSRQIASNVISSAGTVSIEGYFIDAVPFESLPGAQEAAAQRQANAYATLREIARWQLNPAYPLSPGWKNESESNKAPFDDILIFSGEIGRQGMLLEKVFPGIADVITTRLDRATGAGSSADWFSQMRKARSDRQRNEHQLMVGSAGAYTLRLPVADILSALHARWSNNLLRIFLSGNKENEILFDYHQAGDPGFPSDPEHYIVSFLNGGMGGDAPIESEVLADFLMFGNSDLTDSKELQLALLNSDETMQKTAADRMNRAILHILFGSEKALLLGSRAGRLEYALEFLRKLEDQMNLLIGRLAGDLQMSNLARVANYYRLAAKTHYTQLEILKSALTQSRPNASYGLVEKLQSIESQLENIRAELERLTCRHYFWGKVQVDNSGDRKEFPFMESWWSEFLAARAEDYVDVLGWTVTEQGVDLELWVDDQPIYLLKDGGSQVVEGLKHIAGTLTASIWQGTNLSLADVVVSHRYFDLMSEGEMARRRSIEMGILNVGSDPHIPLGRIIYVAPTSMQQAGANTSFERGLEKTLPEESNAVAVETRALQGTDRMSATLLRLQDAADIERLSGYHRSKDAHKHLEGWNKTLQKFEGNGDIPRVTQRAESEAHKLERLDIFRGFDSLHPLVVAALENPVWAELFCLALADGLVQQDTAQHSIYMEVDGLSGRLSLLDGPRSQIDPYVDALLKWSLTSHPESWDSVLSQRFSVIDKLDRSRLNTWLEFPHQDFMQGSPDHRSLGQLISTLVRNFMKSKTRRWKS